MRGTNGITISIDSTKNRQIEYGILALLRHQPQHRVSRSLSLVPTCQQSRVSVLIFACSSANIQLLLIFGINFQTWCSIISRKSLKYRQGRTLSI
ncbi:hypothetical protein L1987_06390 [Smallanthus sonchifolius]|uniref:Uncharacterized protein n=1 Tax=Smallanthus sonchifolius TaxID=185202 RepID=A0ACB9JY36_9ASTR|nr:hypothetical protein L1987_06390 [Smallanthus sonchifolius]